MGGRGSLGGSRSTYRGESTRLFREQQKQQLSDGPDGAAGGSTKEKKNKKAGTGGIEGGGGSVEGGGSAVDTTTVDTPTTDINEQQPPPDQTLQELFEESEEYEAFLDRDVSESAYKREYDKVYSRWVTARTPKVELDFGLDVPELEQQKWQAEWEKMPLHLRQALKERGLQFYVADHASEHPEWGEYELAMGITAEDVIHDGRTYGDLSFYDPTRNEIFVSLYDADDGGTANVMVHEGAHAVDATFLKDPVDVEYDGLTYSVKEISRDDPEWVKMHNDYVLPVKDVDSWFNYFVGGPSEDNDADGRSELFAEGLAAYLQGGKVSLRDFLFYGVKDETSRYALADKMIEIWTRYGILT